MKLRAGVDMIAIRRFEQLHENAGFLNRAFTPEERQYISSRGKGGPQSAAGIFAAKEAVLKALGTGMTGVALGDINITHDEHGAPVAQLSGSAQRRLCDIGGVGISISITHDEGFAMAFAVLWGK